MKNFVSRAGKYVVGALAGGVALAAGASTAAAYDFDNGIGPVDVMIPDYIIPAIYADVAPGDATIILRVTSCVTTAWFDAIAPYHPTAVGVYSTIPRRPASESVTNANKNVA